MKNNKTLREKLNKFFSILTAVCFTGTAASVLSLLFVSQPFDRYVIIAGIVFFIIMFIGCCGWMFTFDYTSQSHDSMNQWANWGYVFMYGDYFDMKKLVKKSEDRVDDELENFRTEVCKVSKGNADVTLNIAHEVEYIKYGINKHYDENYTVNIVYTHKATNQRIVNKFLFISYNETYPVIVKFLKNDDAIQEFNDKDSFHEYLKKVCNEESIVGSIRLSMKKKEDFPLVYRNDGDS